MSGAVGSTTVDFGAAPGGYLAKQTVTGQAGIVSGSAAEAFLMAEASADHTDDEHALIAVSMKLTCGNVVAATGFDIWAVSEFQLVGVWAVRWVWV